MVIKSAMHVAVNESSPIETQTVSSVGSVGMRMRAYVVKLCITRIMSNDAVIDCFIDYYVSYWYFY